VLQYKILSPWRPGVRDVCVKIRFALEQAMKAVSLTVALDGGGRLTPHTGRFTSWHKTWYPLYRRLSRPQRGSGRVRKISSTPGCDPRTVHLIVKHYTDCVDPAPYVCICVCIYIYKYVLYVCVYIYIHTQSNL
jgi:hypothetical protein